MFRLIVLASGFCAAVGFHSNLHGFVASPKLFESNKAFYSSDLVFASRRRQAPNGLLHVRAADFSFGFGQKKQEGKAPFGGENPYRVFGVTEDAPYEEVEFAYKELVAENAGNDKYLIKLEMMKEKIFEDRLKARMSGALKSKIKDSPFEKKLQVRKEPWWTKVAWLKNIVKMPDQKYFIQVSALMACFMLAGLWAPQLASTTMGFGFLSSMGFLYNRGTPEIRRDDMGNPGESRPANYGALGKTLGLCALGGGLGFGLSQVVVTSVALPAFVQPDAVVNLFFNLGLLVTALFFQVQDV